MVDEKKQAGAPEPREDGARSGVAQPGQASGDDTQEQEARARRVFHEQKETD